MKALHRKFAGLRGETFPGFEPGDVRLLVTRPREDAERFATALKQRGHRAVIAPLLELHVISAGEISLDNVQALLASSANGIRAFAARSPRRDLPVYAVGPQTSETARQAGFAQVLSADGDSSALIAKVAGTADPAKGKLLHVAGAETAGRIKQVLETHGFQVDLAILYEAVPVETLPADAREHLRGGMLDGVLMFSPRSARTFAGLVAKEGLAQNCEKLDAFCISAATASALSPLRFARIAVAGTPNQDAMLDLIPSPESAS